MLILLGMSISFLNSYLLNLEKVGVGSLFQILHRDLTYNYPPQGTGNGLTRSCLCAGCAGRSSCAWPRWSATWSPTPGRNHSTARSAASSTRRRETSGWVPQTTVIPYIRDYLMYYRGQAFLAPSPLCRQQVVSLSHSSWMPPVELIYGGGGGGEMGQIILRRELEKVWSSVIH